MNLAICLLMARRFVERHQLRELVEGYHGLSDTAFERLFERDKEELRHLGMPVETGSNSALFPDDVGYRIRRRDAELPPLSFDAAETAALTVASGVWDSARVQDHATQALAKLRAAGLDPDAARVAAFAPSVGAHEPAFDALWDATLTQTPVAFAYRGVDRVVEPWRLTSRNGAWYLVGFDRTRGEGRSFKVSRVADAPRRAGSPGGYALPGPDVIRAHLDSLEPHRDGTAIVAVRHGAAPDLVRFADPVDPVEPSVSNQLTQPVPDGFAAWRIAVPASSPADAAGELAAYAGDLIVLAPRELRAALLKQLKAVAAWA